MINYGEESGDILFDAQGPLWIPCVMSMVHDVLNIVSMLNILLYVMVFMLHSFEIVHIDL